MASPVPPTLGYSYTGFQQEQQENPFPGTQLDNDLSDVKRAIHETIEALADIRRSDGAIKNGVVSADSFTPGLLESTVGVSSFTETARGYADAAGISANSADVSARSAAAIVGSGAFTAPGIGGILRSVQQKLSETISVKDLSAVGDGATNDTAALDAIADRARAETIFFPDGDYYINDTVTWDYPYQSFVFSENARLIWHGAGDRPAVIWGQNTISTNNQNLLGFQLINATTYDFTNDAFVGLRLINVRYACSFIKYIEGFTNLLQLYGSSTGGIAYNAFDLGILNAGKRHIDFVTAIALGFVNDNLFKKGRFANVGYSDTLDSYGVTFRSSDGTNNYGHNNNTFLAPTFELRLGNSGVERIPVDIRANGNHNRFLSTRVEEARGPYMRIDGSGSRVCNNNVFEIGLIAGTFLTGLDVTGANAYNNKLSVQYAQTLPQITLTMNNLWASDTGKIEIAGIPWVDNNGNITRASPLNNAEIASGYLFVSPNCGPSIEIDTTINKHFSVAVAADDACYGRIHVAAYDAAGTRLTSSDTGYPHVISGSLLYSGTSWGGARYSTTSDATASSLYFSVIPSVKKVRLIFAGGTAYAKIRAINLGVTSFGETLIAAGLGPKPVGYLSSQFSRTVTGNPTSVLGQGFVEKGEIFLNSAAASGQPQGWQCTATGISAAAWAISTAYVTGQFRSNDTGKVYVCTTGGTSAGSGGPTGTTSSITDGTVVWAYTGYTLPTYTALANTP